MHMKTHQKLWLEIPEAVGDQCYCSDASVPVFKYNVGFLCVSITNSVAKTTTPHSEYI